jgi:hypothetical protein
MTSSKLGVVIQIQNFIAASASPVTIERMPFCRQRSKIEQNI